MHFDARTLDDGTLIEGDLCIVGAGAAGISMAMEFDGTGHDVVLLEGGGFTLDLETQGLYAGESVGMPYQVPLEVARLHCFGGTTGHWAGWCTTLDPIDYSVRDWVPHSGWPFGPEEMEPYYRRAHRYPQLGPFEYDAAAYETAEMPRMPLDPATFWTKMWRLSPPTRFGTAYRDAIVGSENVRLYTHAVATDITANAPVTAAETVRVQTLNGRTHRVRARHIVLACNAIQNARLLLASRGQAPNGLGNDHDLVGRFFMDHFEMDGAQLVLADESRVRLYLTNDGSHAEIAPSAALQRDHRLLNGTTSIRPGRANQAVLEGPFQRFENRRANLVRDAVGTRGGAATDGSAAAEPSSERATTTFYPLQSRAEQRPNPASRVVLSAVQDRLGMPYADLDWQLSGDDRRSMRRFYELLAVEMGRTGVGRVRLHDWLYEDGWPSFLSGGFHNMGTTRMHEDPRQGVLNADGRVHGIANLFAAGGSMFPTSGAGNPTLTIIALSVRLADHLKGLLG